MQCAINRYVFYSQQLLQAKRVDDALRVLESVPSHISANVQQEVLAWAVDILGKQRHELTVWGFLLGFIHLL